MRARRKRMELLLQYADEVNWKDIIFSGLRIALILVVVWVVLIVVRSLLRRLETALVKKGQVERVNFRTIVLRDNAGTVHVFPNGSITTLSNMTREWSAYVFNIGVAYKEDIDRVIALLKQIGQELRNDAKFGALMQGDIEVFGIDKLDDSAVVIQGRLKTYPIKQWEVGREFHRRDKIPIDDAGIELPFP